MTSLAVSPEVLAYWESAPGDIRHLDVERHAQEIYAHLRTMPGFDRTVPGAWLDWGCGAGSGVVAAMRLGHTDLYTGVDLFPIDGSFGIPVHVFGAGCTSSIPRRSHATVTSFSCFQHMESREYARAVLREMRRIAASGSRGCIQVRYKNAPEPEPEPRSPRYQDRAIRSLSYGLEEFWTELTQAGFTPTFVQIEPWRNYAWFCFEG